MLISPQSIKSVGEDLNRDGLIDRWNVSMRIRKPVFSKSGKGGDLRQMTLVLGFDYQTSKIVKMDMETLAVVQVGLDKLGAGGSGISGSTSVKSIKAVGTLDLVQQSPI